MLPGVGEKTASRLALYVLNSDDDAYVDELCACLRDVKDNVRLCSICMTFSEVDPCAICSSSERDLSKVCVVGDYKDMVAIESSNALSSAELGYQGTYHILHGLLAPLKGVGPEDIRVGELTRRVAGGKVEEVIIATGFDSEGEATAAFVADILRPYEIKLTRIATGVPSGGSIEYMDAKTIARALVGRFGL